MTAAWETKVPISTDGEAEAGSVPSGGPTLSMSTQDPREEVTLVRSVGRLRSWLGADPALVRDPVLILVSKFRGS